ncbi:hypothetical protein [Pseudomonas atagonensis]|uniref:hypothetical protein n=1 Tax=Pseudomonas atagonensis TaxID=2609964 RepID=UPI00140D9DED|nr:hypothetical protein [Pseudomonas atagonensis]
MSAIHDQAMNYVYQQVLQRLLSYFSRAERTALQLLIQRLTVAAGGSDRISDFKVLVIQSGTRDSCYNLALLRAAQLSLASRSPATFQLRVATLRRNGTSAAAMQCMHRSFGALFLYDDPRVEVLMVDHRQVMPFDHQLPISEEGSATTPISLLMIGHRRTHNEALELWDEEYLATAEFYGQIARWNNGVDALVGSEPVRRQKQFLEGLDRAVQKAGIGTLPANFAGFESLFAILDGLGGNYYREIYPASEQTLWRPEGQFEACRRTGYVDINDLLVGNLEERWPLLTEFLGFQLDESARYQEGSEHVDPLITAHLHGLQKQFIAGGDYRDGFTQSLQGLLISMRRSLVPEPVCQQFEAALDSAQACELQRELAAVWLQKTFGLGEMQLVCLLFTPFTRSGEGLERFLRQCHPGMLVALPDLHRAMQGLHAPEQVLKWMIDVSGLPINLICRLYAMEPVCASLENTQENVEASESADEGTLCDRSAEG